MQNSIFSVDVEDWFHILDIPGAPTLAEWDRLPSRVEKNFIRLLDLFSEYRVQVTCFVLGWVGERFPHLVKEAVARGHEIASHGYAHRLVYEQSREEFFADVHKARLLLEDVAGAPVAGYRAPGFSTTDETPWFFEVLAEAGYQYDSSLFPAHRSHGGIPQGRRDPYRVNGDGILELPITVADFMGRGMCFFGGGYLRFFPYWLICKKAKEVVAEGRPVVFYIHPREIDPGHPRLPMKSTRAFKSYVNLAGTEAKLRSILRDFPVTTFQQVINSNPKLEKSHVVA
ncbi:MAG TPA: XrtA system polysaccharide deacetylase [Terriglobales bacterium]|nr:XrtA system polysaccharide deacetylase [Terriglobales bacterium]